MDVGIISGDTWEGIHRMTIGLWLLLPLAVIFGLSLLLSLAIIPSLIYTGELSPRAERLRLPLYALALVSGAALAAALIIVGLDAGVIGEFWPRWLL